MLACVRGLVDVVRKDLVANVLVYEHQGITVDDGGGAAPKDVRVLLLGGEPGNLLGDVGRVEHLRHAEVQITARLLRKELRLKGRHRGIVMAER